MNESAVKRVFSKLLMAAVIGLGLYLFFRYLFLAVLPFAAAFVFACLFRKVILFLCRKVRLPRGLAVFLFTALFFGVTLGGMWLLVSKTAEELMELLTGFDSGALSERAGQLADSAAKFAAKLSPDLGKRVQMKLDGIFRDVDTLLLAAANRFLPVLADAALAFFKALPRVFVSFGTFLLALFYFESDYERITAFIRRQLSEKQAAFIRELKREFFDTVVSVLRAYAILLVMTFAELAVGFSILGRRMRCFRHLSSRLWIFCRCSAPGTVLVPWSVGAFFTGNTKLGLCLAALYGIITVIRQIAEPKILGSSVGMHPLATLLAMYIGLKLCGIGGLFLFPIGAVILKNLNESGFIRLYKMPETDDTERIKKKFQTAKKENPK